MERYEDGAKFWEIELKGTKVDQKWGKLGGSSASTSSKSFPDAAAAKKAYAKLVADKTSNGFQPAGKAKAPAAVKPAAKPPAKNADLEKAIIANPDDDDAYLVYADWLQAQGNAHGELVVLQHAKSKKASTLLEKLKPELLGEFATRPPTKHFDLEWKRGFIYKAKFGWEGFRDEARSDEETEADDHYADRFERFLKLPAARFVQELVLGPIPGDDMCQLDSFAIAIDRFPPPCLRVLDLSDTGNWDISSTEASMPDSKSIRGIKKICLNAGGIGVSKIDLPECVEFTIRTGGLSKDAAREIGKAKLPSCERLEIWFGDPHYGGNSSVDDIKPLLAAKAIPKVKHLLFKNCAFADELVKALAKSPLLRQIETLDLSMGNLSDAGIATMVAAKDAFAHLAELELEDNAMTDAAKPLVKGLAKSVNFGRGHSPERAVPRAKDDRWSRYVAVGE